MLYIWRYIGFGNIRCMAPAGLLTQTTRVLSGESTHPECSVNFSCTCFVLRRNVESRSPFGCHDVSCCSDARSLSGRSYAYCQCAAPVRGAAERRRGAAACDDCDLCRRPAATAAPAPPSAAADAYAGTSTDNTTGERQHPHMCDKSLSPVAYTPVI
jgi:hypothetical protein